MIKQLSVLLLLYNLNLYSFETNYKEAIIAKGWSEVIKNKIHKITILPTDNFKYRMLLYLNNSKIGELLFQQEDECFYISYLDIREEFRRQGYGTALLKAACRYFFSFKINYVYLCIVLEEDYLGSFYEKIGFKADPNDKYWMYMYSINELSK